MEKISINIKHPKELIYFGISRILERISYYGIRSFLMIYMTSKVLNFTEIKSVEIYSYFTIAIAFTPIIGAIIGDLKIGNRKASIFGLILNIIGSTILLIPNQYSFFISLGIISLGIGFYNPNFNAQLGKTYLNKEKLMDGGFTIMWTLINLGAFLGPIVIGYFFEEKFKYAIVISILLNLISLFFQLKINDKMNKEQIIKIVPKTNWKKIAIILIGGSVFWISCNYIEGEYFLKSASNLNFDTNDYYNFDMIKNILSILLGIISCFIWTVKYIDSNTKIKFSLATLLISIIVIVIFNNMSNIVYLKNFQVVIILLSIIEILLAPIIYSFVVQNTNTKYLAIVLSLTFISNQIFREIFSKIESYFNLTNINVLTILLVIIIPIFIVLLIDKKKNEIIQASA
jgi:proton-dependent oligopeptide transporter, POT family